LTIELEAELKYYLKNRNKLSKAKEYLTSLHGTDGFNWLLDKVTVKPNKSLALNNRLTFKRKVQALTEKQPLYLLENFEKRGFRTGYHVDHIVSIFKAYKLGWTVEQCADISNLQMLPFEENLKKGIK